MPYLLRNTLLAGALSLSACAGEADDRDSATQPGSGIVSLSDPPGGESTGETGDGPLTSGEQGTSVAGDTSAAESEGGGPKFDIGGLPDTPGDATDGVDCGADPDQPGCACSIPAHVPCDDDTMGPFKAMGLNCPGELQVMASLVGDDGAIGVRSGFGQTATFNAREGSRYAVIGSGLLADLDLPTPPGDSNQGPTHCNDPLAGSPDPGAGLPAPLKVNSVGGDCTTDPALLGTGDCSNTIQGQFSQGGYSYDYTEMRFILEVPPGVTSFSYDFAFFSVEYPWYYGTGFNDMYVGWLDSEKWTGNISFDQQGHPISLNAGFLEFKDDGGSDPVFAGTCMRQHGGTSWLQTTAGVTPGETITVVFAIFDLGDQFLDSYAFIDNFQWGCEPTGKPQTMPPS